MYVEGMDTQTFLMFVNLYAANLLKGPAINIYPALKRARLVSLEEVQHAGGAEKAAWDYICFISGFTKRPSWMYQTPEEQRANQALGGKY